MAKQEMLHDNGVEIFQVTELERRVSNLYCERPYCSADSSQFLYSRAPADDRPGWEYVLCSFGDWEEEVVGRGRVEIMVSYNNDYYYIRSADGKRDEIVRMDLNTGGSEVVYEFEKAAGVVRHPTVSPDSRYFAWHTVISFDPQLFGIYLLDLTTGRIDCICEDKYTSNAHLQFCPVDPELLLVQHNLGCRFDRDGNRECCTTGATLFLLDVHGKRTELPIGEPHCPFITGHQAWLGESREIIATVQPKDDYAAAPEGKGTIVRIDESLQLHQIPTGMVMNHVGTPPTGRIFHADMIAHDHIILGNADTGKTVEITRLEDDPFPGSTFNQESHPHAALMPGREWMIFNSDRTGRPQVYAARIPQELFAELD